MAAPNQNKRIINEVTKLKTLPSNNDRQFILDKSPVDDPSSSVILGRILPKASIYNQAAFQIELKLPAEYPFKAPEVRFVTPIYHPNVDDKGKICVDIINAAEAYKPTTPLLDIITAVVNLIDNPNIEHALNAEIATEYSSNKSTFDKKALEMVKKHGLPRS